MIDVLTCYSCLHSFGTDDRLMCSRSMQPAPINPCPEFSFEPGTDESEREEAKNDLPSV